MFGARWNAVFGLSAYLTCSFLGQSSTSELNLGLGQVIASAVSDHELWMHRAIEEAAKGLGRTSPNPPVGAVIVRDGAELGAGWHRAAGQPHAEREAIANAKYTHGKDVLRGASIYVTLEPCTMCAGAISFARSRRVVMGALDEKGGGVLHGAKFYDQPTCHHRPEIESGVMAAECGTILREFFKGKR